MPDIYTAINSKISLFGRNDKLTRGSFNFINFNAFTLTNAQIF